MRLEHSFTVPVGVEEAWRVLLDIERIAPCMPGAAIDSVDGDDFTGKVKVKLGPINLTYKGKASFIEKDEQAHRAVIDAQGKDTRGNGTAGAKITARLEPDGDATKVSVRTELNITGKPAQFGRGVMADVGNKLLGQFAECLATQLSGGAEAGDPGAAEPEQFTAEAEPDGTEAERGGAEAEPASADPEPTATDSPAAPSGVVTGSGAAAAAATAPLRQAPREPEPINLIASAGPAVAKRAAPVLGAVALAVIVVAISRRRRHRH